MYLISVPLQRLGAARVLKRQSRDVNCDGRAARARERGEAGYVAVDAMVALLIISLSTILSLQAVRSAHQAVTAANEYKRAEILLSFLLDTGPRSFTPSRGRAGGFTWTLVTQPTGLDRPIAVCRRALTVQAEQSARVYNASTREICPGAAS